MRWRRLTLVVLLACGCDSTERLERDIEDATRAIAAAPTEAARAQAHDTRGRAYNEKAHYSRHHKLISSEEYTRLFELAVKDHDQAVALAPADAQWYLSRGLTYYDRAALEDQAAPATRALYDAAKADFTRTLERDGRNVRALDMRGLVYTSEEAHDEAIADFTLEMAIDPDGGRWRLADAYCRRGSYLYRARKPDLAISDYEKALELGGASDACECQPEDPLVTLLLEKGDYDRAWEVVRKARDSNRRIAPEILEQLKKASGRSG